MVFRWSLVILFFVAAYSASLAQQPASTSKAQPASPKVVLAEGDNGRDIDLTIGSTLLVNLPGNPSTGYTWAVAGDPSPLKLQKASFHKGKKQGGAVGAPGIAVFYFTAKSSGMATLTLVYRRSWEYNVQPMKTFTVRVDVR